MRRPDLAGDGPEPRAAVRTTHGGVAFPTCTTDRVLRDGDVVWVDTGIDYEGYVSDFGRTWIVGGRRARARASAISSAAGAT